MKIFLKTLAVGLLFAAITTMIAFAGPVPEDEALKVLDAYLEAFNKKDTAALQALHHNQCFYVNTEGEVEVYEERDLMQPLFLSQEIKQVDWQKAAWEIRDAVQSSLNKVHVVTRLTLFREDGSRVQGHDAIYIITMKDKWGIAGVSTLPPVNYGPGGALKEVLPPDAQAALEEKAIQVLDEFMKTFNAEDEDAHLDVHNFPHFRLANEKLKITDRDSHLLGSPFFFFLLKVSTGFKWNRSDWDQRTVAHVSENKIHVITRFSRYTKENEKYGTYDSLYILNLQDGKWGVKGRSSFAPL